MTLQRQDKLSFESNYDLAGSGSQIPHRIAGAWGCLPTRFSRQHLAVSSGDLAGECPNGSVQCLNPFALLSTARARTRTGTPW